MISVVCSLPLQNQGSITKKDYSKVGNFWTQLSRWQKNQFDLRFHYQVSNQQDRLKGTKLAKRQFKNRFQFSLATLGFSFSRMKLKRAYNNENISRSLNTWLLFSCLLAPRIPVMEFISRQLTYVNGCQLHLVTFTIEETKLSVRLIKLEGSGIWWIDRSGHGKNFSEFNVNFQYKRIFWFLQYCVLTPQFAVCQVRV